MVLENHFGPGKSRKLKLKVLESSSSSSGSSSDAKRSAEASRRCDCSPERSVLQGPGNWKVLGKHP